MEKEGKKGDKSSWAIGGTTLIGIGVGFVFLKTSPLFFVASILIGIGAGLVITALISREKKKRRLVGKPMLLTNAPSHIGRKFDRPNCAW